MNRRAVKAVRGGPVLTCQAKGTFLMLVVARASATIFHMLFVTFAPRYFVKVSRTAGTDAMPASSAPKPSVPAMAGSLPAADMFTCVYRNILTANETEKSGLFNGIHWRRSRCM